MGGAGVDQSIPDGAGDRFRGVEPGDDAGSGGCVAVRTEQLTQLVPTVTGIVIAVVEDIRDTAPPGPAR